MKHLLTLILAIVTGTIILAQKPVAETKYKIKEFPIPITDCSSSEEIITVKQGKTLTLLSYRVERNSYLVRFDNNVGCVEEKWIPNVDLKFKNYFVRIYNDSIQKIRQKRLQDSLALDNLNKESIKLGYGALPQKGDTLVCYKSGSLWVDHIRMKEIDKLSIGQKVVYIEVVPGRFHMCKISSNNKEGVVLRGNLKTVPDYTVYSIEQARILEERRKLEIQQKIEDLEYQKAMLVEEKAIFERMRANLIKKYGHTTAQRILDGKIWLGMTKEMAIDSWGSPDNINRSVGSWGVHEQWIYDSYEAYLYFENGILTSWQDVQ